MAPPGSASASPRVLVADDDSQLLQLFERLLARAGYGVLLAADGEQATRLLAEASEPIAAAVIDGAIPPRGAGEIVHAILARGGDTGFVLTSGDALEAGLSKLVEERDGIFLRKPFPPHELLRALEDVLAGAAGS